MSYLPLQNPTETKSWKKLQEIFEKTKNDKITDWFNQNPSRWSELSFFWQDFTIDISKNSINKEILDSLIDLAKDCHLQEAIENCFSGKKINETENRKVLHTALRVSLENHNTLKNPLLKECFTEINAVKKKMKDFCESIITGTHKGYTQKSIDTIVNIGVGGSDLGPVMVTESLAHYRNHLNLHYISNVDGDHVMECLGKLNPETTLFIIVSKSFSTQETLTNSNTVRKWFLSQEGSSEKDIAKHFVAVSSNIEKACEFGIDTNNIFKMWDWVGGRFSLWSAVGLSIALGIGYEKFEKLLEGAEQMDIHFRKTPLEKNIPVILALLEIWQTNFHKNQNTAIIPYTQYLKSLPSYLQQGFMESNGKSIDRNGNKVNYDTQGILWGGTGTNTQHAFFQLIHQGTKGIPTEFIGFIQSLHDNKEHHDKLMANLFGQSQALLKGRSLQEVTTLLKQKGVPQETIDKIAPHKVFEGNKPSTTILIDKLTPYNLGALLSMYEHRIFVTGIIWNVYSYDQWGVELGKTVANSILDEFEHNNITTRDSSTEELLKLYQNKNLVTQ